MASGKPLSVMQTQPSTKSCKLLIAGYCCLLLWSFLDLSAPPGKLAVYVGMGILALIAYVLGKGFLRGLAAGLFFVALCLAVVEYNRGQELHQRLHEIRDRAKEAPR